MIYTETCSASKIAQLSHIPAEQQCIREKRENKVPNVLYYSTINIQNDNPQQYQALKRKPTKKRKEKKKERKKRKKKERKTELTRKMIPKTLRTA